MPSSVEHFRKALDTNATSTAFTAPTVSAVEPTAAGVCDLTTHWGGGSRIPSHLQLAPFGVGADGTTFDVRVYGWNKVSALALWIPQLIADLSCTVTTIAATALGASNVLVDTITVNDGAADSSVWRSLVDCQEDLPASVIVHTRGCQYVTFDFDMTGATSGNLLVRPLEL